MWGARDYAKLSERDLLKQDSAQLLLWTLRGVVRLLISLLPLLVLLLVLNCWDDDDAIHHRGRMPIVLCHFVRERNVRGRKHDRSTKPAISFAFRNGRHEPLRFGCVGVVVEVFAVDRLVAFLPRTSRESNLRTFL